MEIVKRTSGDYAAAFSEIRKLPAADVEQERDGRLVVLPTMWYRDDTIRQAEAILRKSNFYVFPHIRYSKRIDTLTFRRELGSRHTALIKDGGDDGTD